MVRGSVGRPNGAGLREGDPDSQFQRSLSTARDLVFYGRYGEPAFADVVADAKKIALLQPTEDWLAAVPDELRKRAVRASTLEDAARLREPAFVEAA